MARTDPCSVDDCDRKVIARGLCPTHYNVSRKGGDPQQYRIRIIPARLDVAEHLKHGTLGSSRRLGRYKVYTDVDTGRPYVLSNRADGRIARKFGTIEECVLCSKEFFRLDTGSKRWRTCSPQCAKRLLRRSKREKAIEQRSASLRSLDKWFSVIVRTPGRCVNCASEQRLQAAHIVSRRYHGVRFDFDNAVCLCVRCHMYFTHHPLEWDDWVTERIGAEAYADIKRRALAFRGPLDRDSVRARLYRRAEELDLSIEGSIPAGHSGWRGERADDEL